MTNRKIISGPDLYPLEVQEGLSHDRKIQAFRNEIEEFNNKILITELPLNNYDNQTIYYFDKYSVIVHNDILAKFINKFNSFIHKNILNYDNLINICIMVKNAGNGFADILRQNLHFMDRYTILDTGSTDNTVEIAREILKEKRGEIYQEPFINFRDSRNRLLSLAGNHCHFNIMLDDTYVITGKLREFLDIARGDDKVDSYSISIEGIDTIYMSNRITKPEKGLQYVNLLHEVIEANFNCSIPYNYGKIIDVSSEYMNKRTLARKRSDLDILIKMHEQNPDEARTYYYIADTYLALKEWNNAYEWFKKRIQLGGYISEVQDSLYYIAVLKDMYLGYNWEECFDDYLRCYEADPTRSESLYFLSTHYKNKEMKQTSYFFLKKAYDLGLPAIQMSVRKDIYNYHIPKDLAFLCFELEKYKLAEECARKAHEYKNDNLLESLIKSLYHINVTNINNNTKKLISITQKVIAFISPGGWNEWDGETLHTTGLGGSENFTIKHAEHLTTLGYKCIVFCNCPVDGKIYNNVTYIQLQNFSLIASNHIIDYAIINRYVEYIAVCSLNKIKTYLVLHDVPKLDEVITVMPYLKNILLLTQWHKDKFIEFFPQYKNICEVISYGIDTKLYENSNKTKYMFIYPSFPNRGLYQLLLMWPHILKKYPQARLHTFCDTKNSWCQQYWKNEMDNVEDLLKQHNNTVINHGWVNGETLRTYWKQAHIWFYPCTFEETFCLTALEAAASKTLVVSNNLAALKENIGSRGIIVPGNPRQQSWHKAILDRMFEVLDNEAEHEYTSRNFSWVLNKNYDIVTKEFVYRFLN